MTAREFKRFIGLQGDISDRIGQALLENNNGTQARYWRESYNTAQKSQMNVYVRFFGSERFLIKG